MFSFPAEYFFQKSLLIIKATKLIRYIKKEIFYGTKFAMIIMGDQTVAQAGQIKTPGGTRMISTCKSEIC
jgi:hypothetical protein